MKRKDINILLVEDEDTYSEILTQVLSAIGTVTLARTLVAAVNMCKKQDFDLVLLDLELPDSQELTTLSQFQAVCPNLPVIILVDPPNEPLAKKAVQQGARDYMLKESKFLETTVARSMVARMVSYALDTTFDLFLSDEEQNLLLETLQYVIGKVDIYGRLLNITSPSNRKPPGEYTGWIGTNIFELVSPEIGQRFKHYIDKALQSKQVQIFEETVKVDGKAFDVEIRVMASGAGEVLFVARDIAERKALERTWRRYEFIVNASKENLSLIDQNYVYQAVNDAYCAAQNKKREEIVGKTVADIWGVQKFETEIKPYIQQCFQGEEVQASEWFNFGALGQRYMEVTYYPFRFEGKVTHCVVVSHDRTTQKLSEEHLQRYNRRLSVLREIDLATLSTLSLDAAAMTALKQIRRMIYFDTGFGMVFDTASENFYIVAQWETELAEADLRFSVKDVFWNPEKELKQNSFDVEIRKITQPKNKLEKILVQEGIGVYLTIPLFVESQLVGVIVLGGEIPETFISDDIETAQELRVHLALLVNNHQLYEQMIFHEEKLRNLSRQLITAQEEERHRIALELHDDIGQILTVLKLQLGIMEKRIESNLDAKKLTGETALLVDQVMDKVRGLAHQLHQSSLDTVGLNETLAEHVRWLAKQSGLSIAYHGVELPGLPSIIATNLFRVVQEALNNVIKHAKARQVQVVLDYQKPFLHLSISDDGVGFEQTTSGRFVDSRGIGLVGMEQRLAVINGKLKILSQVGGGTTIAAEVKWEAK